MSVGHAMKPMSEAHFAILRRHMVEVIGIQVDLASEELGKAALDERVLAAMRNVPRHRFVPSFLAPLAYQDTPLPIGFDKTISQPFIVALMTDRLGRHPRWFRSRPNRQRGSRPRPIWWSLNCSGRLWLRFCTDWRKWATSRDKTSRLNIAGQRVALSSFPHWQPIS